MSTTVSRLDPTDGIRPLGTLPLLGIVAVYLAILLFVPMLTTRALDSFSYGVFPDIETVVHALIVPVGLSVAFAVGVISALRWWAPVRTDHRPVQRWVWFVPATMAVAIVAGTDYGTLADEGIGFTLALLVGTLMVGTGEELVYRGLAVTAFRRNGLTEAKVALWSSVLFGASHSLNIFTEDNSAIPQVLVTTAAGFFFYLVRRVSGGIVVPIVLHGLWDFGLFTGGVTDEAYAGTVLFVLADLVMIVVLLVRRKRIEPVAVTAPA
jgi:membrane protease YdiL (CAAX protease family)